MRGFSFLQEVRQELAKIVWPSRREVLELTFLVVVISAIVGAFVGGLDFLFTSVLNQFVR